MAYQVLARRWRPQRFQDVVGQDHVTKTLANAIRSGRLAHAFLFCGPRGTGKTTTARILAKCLNCELAKDGPVEEPCSECVACREIADGVSLDILEIDGASNRGIDEIRDLRENVRYAPSRGRAKVYIIDEVHMLTKEAFNALLKTLEEPPPGVYFVFATTEIHKVPATIRSRCQRYDFHRISHDTIVSTLKSLAEREKIEVDEVALSELARQADGGLRDAQSLLDQASSVGDGTVTAETVRSLLGETEESASLAILEELGKGEAGPAFVTLSDLLDRGMDPSRIALSITQALRDLLVVQAAGDEAHTLGVRRDLVDEYKRVAAGFSRDRLTAFLTLAHQTVAELRRSQRPRLALEVSLARLARLPDPGAWEELVARIQSAPPPAGAGPDSSPPAKPKSRSVPAAEEPPPPDWHEHPPPEASQAAASRPAAPPPPARPSPPAAGSVSSDLGRLWEALIARVQARKKMLASFLEHGAPSSFDDQEGLQAVFENSYYEGMVTRNENLSVIHDELAAIAGKKVRFKARVGEVQGRVVKKPSSAKETRDRAKDVLDENPGLSRIVKDLGGTLLPGGGNAS